MEVNAYRKGMGKMFKRFMFNEVQEYNGQQNKGNKNLGRRDSVTIQLNN